MAEIFDIAVIGGGPGGYVAAIKAAQLGMNTVLFENRELGGTCLNRGCVPTKSFLHSAELYSEAKNMEEFGVNCESVTPNFEKMKENRDNTVSTLNGGIAQLLKQNGVTVINAKACVGENNTITYNDGEEVIAKDIIIAAGSSPARLPIEGVDLEGVYTSDEFTQEIKNLDSLIIIGGGVIGTEFASVYSAFGVKVTIIEAMERVLAMMDREVSQSLQMSFKKRGVDVFTSARVMKLEKAENGVTCRYIAKDKECEVTAQAVLVSVGRRANTEGLFKDGFTLECERGYIKVDDKFQTSKEHIYAIGDIIGKIQLAHMASAQGICAVENILGKENSICLDAVPSCIYTSPEIASVGMSEDAAKNNGFDAVTGKYLTSGNARTLIAGGGRGFIKVTAEKDGGKILGAQLMCERATDIVNEFTTAIANSLTAKDMAKAIRPHPTFAEAVTEAVEDTMGHAVHIMPKRKR